MYRKDNQNEFYTRLAQEQGYPARSVYKLQEIDKKFKIFNKGDVVLDLGCAPGSWLMYVSQKVGDKGKAIGVDIGELKIPQKNNVVFINKSIFDLEESDLKNKFDAVVADLSPRTSGIKLIDTGRSLELAEKAFEIAKSVLRSGGNFVCKIFESESSDQLFKEAEKCFDFTKRFVPKAVVKGSKEFYIVGKKYRKLNG